MALLAVMAAFAKQLAVTHNVIEIAFYRNSIAIVPLAGVILATGKTHLLKARKPLILFLRVTVGFVSLTILFEAYALLPLADATVIVMTAALFAPALSFLIGERVGEKRWTVIIIGLIGVAIMAHPTGHVAFLGAIAAFTTASRITHEVFVLWLEILNAVPDSVLWLKQANALTMQNLRAAAQAGGIAAERLHFAQRVPRKADHLARLALADLALDTIIWHNGHSTTNDLLWAGVPVLTTAGRTFASRVGASLVTAAGLPELVAQDTRDYVNIAIRLGSDRAQCAVLKQRLSANQSKSLFFDARRIVAGLEAVYLEMWRRHTSGTPPHRIDTR